MRKSDEQIEQQRRDRFEVMAVRLANHLNLSSAERWADLPQTARDYFNGQKYCDIVKPLIIRDSHKGQSVRQLAIKYGLSSSAVQNHLTKSRSVCEEYA